MKIKYLSLLGISHLVIILMLSGCSIRPYDYLSPPLNTLSASLLGTATYEVTVRMVPTFTPVSTTGVTTLRPLNTKTSTLPAGTKTAEAPETPPAGTVNVLLENRTASTIYIRVRGNAEWSLELAAAEALPVEIPAGVYEYWLVIPGKVSLHGEKVFTPGFASWIFYDTPGVVESPTPWMQ